MAPSPLSSILGPDGQPARRPRATAPQTEGRERVFRDGERYIYTGAVSRELPIIGEVDLKSVNELRSIIREHAGGRFERAAMLVEAMLADDRIGGCAKTRIAGLQGLKFSMDPGGGEKPRRQHRKAAKELGAKWKSCFPLSERVSLLRWGIFLGVGLGQLVWERRRSFWTARLETWHPSHVWWDESSQAYFVNTTAGPERIVPGAGRWVLFTPYGYRRGWMDALVRMLAVPYICRLLGTRDYARYSEVHGNPMRKARFPHDTPTDIRDAFVRAVAALGSDTAFALPVKDKAEGTTVDPAQFEVELMEAMGRSHDLFSAFLGRMDTNIAITITGQNLTTEVKGGSYAAAAVHETVRGDIIKLDGEQATDLFHSQCMEPLAVTNYGDADMAPFPNWDTSPPADQKLEADSFRVLGQAINELRKAGAPVDVVALANRFGIPLLLSTETDEETLPPSGLYGYHLQAGIVTVNEARRALGLPPIPGPEGERLVGLMPEETGALQKKGDGSNFTDVDPSEGAALAGLALRVARKSSLRQLLGQGQMLREAQQLQRVFGSGFTRASIKAEILRRKKDGRDTQQQLLRGRLSRLSHPALEQLARRDTHQSFQTAAVMELSARASVAVPSPSMEAGQRYVDETVRYYTEQASAHFGASVGQRILAVLSQASTHEEAKAGLVKLYREEGLGEEGFEELLRKAMTLAEAAGHKSVLDDDTPED